MNHDEPLVTHQPPPKRPQAFEINLTQPGWQDELRRQLTEAGLGSAAIEDTIASAEAQFTRERAQQDDAHRAALARIPRNWQYPYFGRVLAAAAQAATELLLGATKPQLAAEGITPGRLPLAAAGVAFQIAEAVGAEFHARLDAHEKALLDEQLPDQPQAAQ